MRWCRASSWFGVRLAAGAVVAVGLGLAHPASAAAQPVVPCTASTLSITLGPGSDTGGTVEAPLLFTNTGSRPCVTQGFPDVSYRTDADGGTQVGRSAQRDGNPGGVVTLPPGAVASADLTMVQADSVDPSLCRPTSVPGLRVYPPNQRVPVFVPMNTTVCAGNPSNAQLRIAAIKPGPEL
jgi:uncharacterized protein DUF4232